MSVLSVFDGSTRARDVRIVTGHEWSFLSQLLRRGDAAGAYTLPSVLCNILTELGPVYVKLGQLQAPA